MGGVSISHNAVEEHVSVSAMEWGRGRTQSNQMTGRQDNFLCEVLNVSKKRLYFYSIYNASEIL